MKHMKKIASLVLALVMALALAVPAMAGETTAKGTITINNAIEGATYSAYQIFKLESYDAAADHYSYKVADGWEDFFKVDTENPANSGAGSAYVTINENGYVEWIADTTDDGADVKAFAKAAFEYIEAKRIQSTKTSAEVEEGQTTATIDELPLGYYLVNSSAGTVLSLDTTNPNATIAEKNESPSVDKEVEEDDWRKDNDGWGDTNDANIGQVVNFHTTITVVAGAKNYVLHDKMDKTLDFDDKSVEVTIDGATVPEGSYTLIAPAEHKDDDGNITETCTFDVVFTQNWLDTLEVGTEIVVSYQAALNASAVVASPNVNETDLTYGEGSRTEKDYTKTYTWGFNVHKYTETANDKDVPLAGATFQLKANVVVDGKDTVGAPLTFKEVTKKDEDGKEYTVYQYDVNGSVKEFTTDGENDIIFEGLDSGIYWLEESEAPEGYNKLAKPIKVEITATEGTDTDGLKGLTHTLTSTLNEETNSHADDTIPVENKTGPELPSTGGIGTTIFYVVGGLLAAGAVILLITKRRMNVGE